MVAGDGSTVRIPARIRPVCIKGGSYQEIALAMPPDGGNWCLFRVCVTTWSSLRDLNDSSTLPSAEARWAKLGRPLRLRSEQALRGWILGQSVPPDRPNTSPHAHSSGAEAQTFPDSRFGGDCLTASVRVSFLFHLDHAYDNIHSGPRFSLSSTRCNPVPHTLGGCPGLRPRPPGRRRGASSRYGPAEATRFREAQKIQACVERRGSLWLDPHCSARPRFS